MPKGTPKASLTIEGQDLLRKAFLALEPKLARKVIRQSIRKSLAPVRDEARRLAPPEVAKQIKIRSWPKRKRGMIALEVRIGDRDLEPEQFEKALKSEYGSKDEAAEPFMRPAYDEKGPAALSEAQQLIRQGIEREAKS